MTPEDPTRSDPSEAARHEFLYGHPKESGTSVHHDPKSKQTNKSTKEDSVKSKIQTYSNKDLNQRNFFIV